MEYRKRLSHINAWRWDGKKETHEDINTTAGGFGSMFDDRYEYHPLYGDFIICRVGDWFVQYEDDFCCSFTDAKFKSLFLKL